jgi:hypothetical protein
MVYPRPIDLEATDKIRSFPFTQVVDSVDQLKDAISRRLASLA